MQPRAAPGVSAHPEREGHRMKRRLFMLTSLVAVAASAAASTPSYGAYVHRATVNASQSVTVEWTFASTDVAVTSIAVDCCVVQRWSELNRSTAFTTAPLHVGRHTIAIEVLERFWTNTYFGSLNCTSSGRASYVWVCYRRTWATPIAVRVQASPRALCVVPKVSGLRLRDARARIELANCTVGVVMRSHPTRRPGTVLSQRPGPNKQLPQSAVVTLVVSKA
jgi:hypothetical protein